jgi:hypothetical protein
LNDKQLTVIVASFKTQNDMSLWSREVQEERDQLVKKVNLNFTIANFIYFILMYLFKKKFFDFAQHLCQNIESIGYWADFIDPSSGKPVIFKSPSLFS